MLQLLNQNNGFDMQCKVGVRSRRIIIFIKRSFVINKAIRTYSFGPRKIQIRTWLPVQILQNTQALFKFPWRSYCLINIDLY